jgi:hypothetical protein
MANTARFALPLLSEAQASAEVVVNDFLNLLDGLVGCHIKDRDANTPPGSPAAGDCYIVAAGGTGAWAGQDGKLAIYAGGWVFAPVTAGLVVYVEDEDIFVGKKASGAFATLG